MEHQQNWQSAKKNFILNYVPSDNTRIAGKYNFRKCAYTFFLSAQIRMFSYFRYNCTVCFRVIKNTIKLGTNVKQTCFHYSWAVCFTHIHIKIFLHTLIKTLPVTLRIHTTLFLGKNVVFESKIAHFWWKTYKKKFLFQKCTIKCSFMCRIFIWWTFAVKWSIIRFCVRW